MSHFETLFVALIHGSVLAVLMGLRVRARGIPFKPGIPPRTKLRFAAFIRVLGYASLAASAFFGLLAVIVFFGPDPASGPWIFLAGLAAFFVSTFVLLAFLAEASQRAASPVQETG